MDMAERKKNIDRDGIDTGLSRTGSISPKSVTIKPNSIYFDVRQRDRRIWHDTQGSEKPNRAEPAYENKTEKELNSLVKTRFKFNIPLNKFFKTIKKIVLWNRQKKRW